MNAQRRLILLGSVWSWLNEAGFGAISPLLMVYAAHQGLSTQQIAFIGAMRQVVSAPGCLLWSGLADHFKAHKAVLLMLVVVAAGIRTTMFWGSSFPALMGMMLCYRFVSSSVAPLADAIIISGMDEGADYGKVAAWGAVGYAALSGLSGLFVDRFGWLSAFIVGAGLALASCLPAAALTFRGKEDRAMQQLQKKKQLASASPSATGEQQLPGDAHEWEDSGSQHSRPGSGLVPLSALRDPLSSRMPPLVSLLAKHGAGSGSCGDRSTHSIQDSSTNSSKDTAAVIIQMDGGDTEADDGNSNTASDSSSSGGHAAAVVITMPATAKPCAKPTKPACQEQQDEDQAAEELLALAQLNRLQKARLLLRDWRVGLLLWQGFLQGLGSGCNSVFLLLMLRGMGASNLMMGLAVMMERLVFSTAYFLVAPLLRRVQIHTLMKLSLAAWVVQLSLNALIPLARSPWVALPVQLLAINYPWGWSACTIRAKQLAPPGLQATMQGLLAMSCLSAGTALGTLVGGQLMGAIGAQWMFVTMAGIMAAALALTAVLDRRSSISSPGPASVATNN